MPVRRHCLATIGCCDEWPASTVYLLVLAPLPRRSASGESIVVLGVCVSVCLSAQPRLHARRCPPSRNFRRIALVSAAKVMRCIQCCPVFPGMFFQVLRSGTSSVLPRVAHLKGAGCIGFSCLTTVSQMCASFQSFGASALLFGWQSELGMPSFKRLNDV